MAVSCNACSVIGTSFQTSRHSVSTASQQCLQRRFCSTFVSTTFCKANLSCILLCACMMAVEPSDSVTSNKGIIFSFPVLFAHMQRPFVVCSSRGFSTRIRTAPSFLVAGEDLTHVFRLSNRLRNCLDQRLTP